MRTLYLLIVIYVALITTGCATTTPDVSSPSSAELLPTNLQGKDPIKVSILNKESPDHPYKVLGKAEISKFNLVGIKRQEAIVRDLMREAAASLGGDAVIDVKHDDKTVTATVIAYQRILV